MFADDSLPWKTVHPICDDIHDVRMAESFDADFSTNSKKDSMNLDSHLEASITAGLIENFKGASHFINDRPDPGQITSTFVWTGMSQEEYFNDLEDWDFEFQLPDGKKQTHLVVGVIYGAQAYCVFSQDLHDKQGHEETRKKSQENLSNVTKKFWAAIDSNLDVADFKREFDTQEKHKLTRFKCRLYSDLQEETVRHCNIFDAYEHILKLQQLVFQNSDQVVPVAMKICPLKILKDSMENRIGSRDWLERYDFSDTLVKSYCPILGDLKRIVIKAETLSNCIQNTEDCSSLREFGNTVSRYQNVVKTEFNEQLIAARRGLYHFRDITDLLEHPLFKLSKLEDWLSCKQAEIDMADLMARKSGTTSITFAATKNQLQRHLSINKNNALVLVVPPLNEKTTSILDVMKKYCDNLVDDFGDIADNITQPWHAIQSGRKFVLDNIKEFAVHVEKNQNFLGQVQFLVTFGESSNPFDCNYTIYKDGKLLKDNVRRLPDPPSGLRIHSVTRKVQQTQISSICAEWDYEELGYPCQFLVEYRSKGTSDPWIQQRTIEPNQNTLTFAFETDSTLEFRVAAETVIGRSEFSDVVDTFVSSPGDEDSSVAKKLKKEEVLLPPPANVKVTSVIGTTVELEWTLSPQAESYRVVYWKEGEDPSSAQEMELDVGDWSGCWLEDLQPETKYQFHVTVCNESQETSEPSEPSEFTTNKQLRLVEMLIDKCEKRSNENGLDLYQLPLVSDEAENITFAESFSFDVSKNTGLPGSFYPDITILLVGTSDSGKASLINSFVNFIFGVNLEDPFRFQLVDESQADSRIRVYNIQHTSQFRISRSLTIIDTPNYSQDNDPAQNQEITEMIRNFIDDRDEDFIRGVDLVGFVMDSSASCLTTLQLYIYTSLISIFGNGVKRNINFLLTSAEKEDPSLWNDIVDFGLVTYGPLQLQQQNQHKFNSSIYFCSDSFKCFAEWRENFENFFSSLMEGGECVSLLKQLVDEKKRLKTVVKELVNFLQVRFNHIEELALVEHVNFDDNLEDNFGWFTTVEKVKLPLGDYVTNCTECQITCHRVCSAKNKIADCEVMDHSMPEDIRTCRVCLGKCSWQVHANQQFKWKFSQEQTSLDAIKKKYETKLNMTLTSEELMDWILEEELKEKMEEMAELIESILAFIQHLNTIANYLDPDCAPRCVDIINTVGEFIIRLLQCCDRSFQNEKMTDKLYRLLQAAKVTRNGLFNYDCEEFFLTYEKDEDIYSCSSCSVYDYKF